VTVSVRMDPLLEKELEAAAKRRGITKSQFVIDAVQRALGRKNPYELFLKVKKQEAEGQFGPAPDPKHSRELPYDSEASKAALTKKLRAKHGVGRTR
jgi:predicted DNA-binding protein